MIKSSILWCTRLWSKFLFWMAGPSCIGKIRKDPLPPTPSDWSLKDDYSGLARGLSGGYQLHASHSWLPHPLLVPLSTSGSPAPLLAPHPLPAPPTRSPCPKNEMGISWTVSYLDAWLVLADLRWWFLQLDDFQFSASMMEIGPRQIISSKRMHDLIGKAFLYYRAML